MANSDEGNVIAVPHETTPPWKPLTIDIGPFLDTTSSAEDRRKVAQSWNFALSTIGMCSITNHGIPTQELDGLYSAAFEFFQLPHIEKMKCCLYKGYGYGGYVPQGVEAVGRTTTNAKEVPPDLVENFVFNFGCDPDKEDPLMIPTTPPHLQGLVRSYWSHMTDLMQSLMRLSALALNLPEDFFAHYYQQPKVNLRLAYYAPLECYNDSSSSSQQDSNTRNNPQLLRYGCHTDYTGFTILQQDKHTPGLEVELPNGEWIPMLPDPLIPDALVVNAGDLIQVWTNDIWRSPPHRVVSARPPQQDHPPSSASTSTGRLSLVFFTGPADSTIVEALPGCHGSDRPKRYAPVNARDHLQSKLRKSNV